MALKQTYAHAHTQSLTEQAGEWVTTACNRLLTLIYVNVGGNVMMQVAKILGSLI